VVGTEALASLEVLDHQVLELVDVTRGPEVHQKQHSA
jgi:hypothetical protein